jgi:hypothetical protein
MDDAVREDVYFSFQSLQAEDLKTILEVQANYTPEQSVRSRADTLDRDQLLSEFEPESELETNRDFLLEQDDELTKGVIRQLRRLSKAAPGLMPGQIKNLVAQMPETP